VLLTAFEAALAFVLVHEGGFADRPTDPGGPTARGITQVTYDSWRDQLREARRPVVEISDEEVRLIYFEGYWQKFHCADLAWPLSLVLFDSAVLISKPVHVLQAVLHVAVDGVFGSETRSAAQLAAPRRLARSLVDARCGYHVASAHLSENPGWLERCADLRVEIDR
jgi:lysozyme family protein